MGGVGEQEQDPLGKGVPKVPAGDGITVLGAPVGYENFAREGLTDKVEKVQKVTEMLPLLKDPHLEFVLLRSCLSLPKLMFLLRTLDTTIFGDQLEQFDMVTRGALSRILGTPITDVGWEQAKLPVSMGGLGLRAASDHAGVAFASSLLSAQPLIDTLLGQQGDEEPPVLPQPLLDSISARQGEAATTEQG